jgi:hypothetical protein
LHKKTKDWQPYKAINKSTNKIPKNYSQKSKQSPTPKQSPQSKASQQAVPTVTIPNAKFSTKIRLKRNHSSRIKLTKSYQALTDIK